MFAKGISDKAERLRLLFFAVDRAEEVASLDREGGLRVLCVAKLAAAVSVASGLQHVARGVDRVEAMLGVGGEGSAERLELCDDGIAALVGLVLEDRDLMVSIELDIAVVRSGELGHQDLQAGAVGGHPGACEELLPSGGRRCCRAGRRRAR